jgi:hypothetical protein
MAYTAISDVIDPKCSRINFPLNIPDLPRYWATRTLSKSTARFPSARPEPSSRCRSGKRSAHSRPSQKAQR